MNQWNIAYKRHWISWHVRIVGLITKNPAYGRQSISRPMRIVARMPYKGGTRIPQNPIFFNNGKNHPKRKNSKTSRKMPKLAICPSTRGLLSIRKRQLCQESKPRQSHRWTFQPSRTQFVRPLNNCHWTKQKK